MLATLHFDPSILAAKYRVEIRAQIEALALKRPIKVVGLLATDSAPSKTYAQYAATGCKEAGITFALRKCARKDIESIIKDCNQDESVHGLMVFYPIFSPERDRAIQEIIDPRKDVEGLSTFWTSKLYQNQRFIAHSGEQQDKVGKKAVLPCTPLAILKILEAVIDESKPFQDKIISIFNRSEVVGKPLASMLANDGALVYSFDLDGAREFRIDCRADKSTITRAEALAKSSIVITGVPSRSFDQVQRNEICEGAVCLNFSTLKNFADDIDGRASVFVPRVGPMTVTMLVRNTLRLHQNFSEST